MNASISVLIPFRDAAATLETALAGVLASGEHALEVLAIDDGSNDSGPERVRTWARRDPRLKLFRTGGTGLVAALSLGLSHAQGALIARMDADDISHPTRLARQREYFREHPEIAVLGTRVRAFADDGEVGAGLARYVAWQNALLTPEDHRRERFVESPLCHPSVMMRRSVLEYLGGYRALDGPEDYELFLRVLEHGYALAKLPEVLLEWRHRVTRTTFADPRYGRDRFRAVKAPYLARELARCARKRLVVWGAGPTGRRLARALSEHGMHCELFVDIDPRKIGRTARNAPICTAAALDARKDMVVGAVGAAGARALIRTELTARGFREGENVWFAA